MERYITSRTRTQVTIVYNGVKLADIMDAAKPTFGGDRRRVLLYAGNLGRVQALDVLVRAIAELGRCGGMDGWEVRLVGNGAVRTELIALIKDLGLEGGVKVQPPVARSQIAQEVCQADALFLGLKSDPALRLTIPSKLFDCLAANKPVVAAITGEGAEIAGRSGGNVVCAPGETAALRKALEILFANFDDLAARALRNSNIIRESFTREKAVSVLADVLHRVHREGLDGH
jgi:glycosyltransferase involved in cell wall biosynthesis